MAYLDVISLAEAKNYLRVDDTLTTDDNAITRMIKASLEYVESWTNVLVFARNKSYIMVDGCVTVYDSPINMLISPTDADVERKTLYNNYSFGTDTSDLVLNVGHAMPGNVPDALKDVAFEIIDLMYYEHETGKTVTKDLSSLSTDILNKYKRFIL